MTGQAPPAAWQRARPSGTVGRVMLAGGAAVAWVAASVVNEHVVLAGRVPSVAQLMDLLSVHTGQNPDGSTGTGA